MGLRIQNNIAALNSYNSVNRTDKAVTSSLEKLSSGYRINKAADDAAGLVVSEGLRSQIGGLTVASRNAQDGVNVAQTADGALSETTSILQRMRDLAVQASNSGSQDTTAQAAANSEFSALSSELSRIAQTTSFGGQKLLSGGYNGQFQVGANNTSNDRISIDLSSASALFSGATTGTAGATATASFVTSGTAPATGDKFTFNDGSGAITVTGQTTVQGVADALNANAAFTAKYTAVNTSGTIKITSKTQDTAQAALTLTTDSTTASIATASAVTAGATPTPASGIKGFDVTGLGLSTTTISTTAGAQAAIDAISNALSGVSSARASIGAVQNRFEHAINNLSVSIENITASESAIRDTDMAAEMTKFTKNQILSQAGTSMLAQANSSTQNILTLLRG